MQYAGRKLVEWRVGRSEAENVGVGDRLGAHSGTHRVADHAADARVGAAVRLQGRRMVVRLHLEDHVVAVVEADDSGVVLEDAYAPVVLARRLAYLHRGVEDRLAEHILEGSFAVRVAVADPPGQRLVAAMLAPGLGDRFQFDVGRVALERLEMGLDCPHLDQREVKLTFQGQPLERFVVELPDGYGDQLEIVRRADLQMLEFQRPDDDLLDCVVGQHLRRKQFDLIVGNPADPILPQCAGRLGLDLEIGNRRQGTLRHGVRHARLGQNVDQPPVGLRWIGEDRVADRGHDGPFHHAVGQQFGGNSFHLLLIELALDQISTRARYGQIGRQSQVGGLSNNQIGNQVGLPFGRIDVNFPKHRGSSWLRLLVVPIRPGRLCGWR